MIAPPHAADFLATAGWPGAAILPLAGDASFRRYFRVRDAGRAAVLMDAPPPEDPRPFIAVGEQLLAAGLAAPRVLAADLERGLLLLDDFGDAQMKGVVEADPAAEEAIYADAVDLLVHLQRHGAGALPPYDRDVLLREARLLPEWYAPMTGQAVDAAGYDAAWDAVLEPLYQPAARAVVVLRDYHSENIMLLDGRSGIDRLGLLDYQDALAGHPAYDLVSLLQDARRDVPDALEAAMLARFRSATAGDEAFDAAYHLLGAQRNAKIIGIFARLAVRDGKPRYLELLPRVWRYLERDLNHPALKPVADWFALNLPADRREGHR
ncbi:aminoglycoside phosphotransferase family protein [Sphingomonas jejuensis]|nr:phosphotransferase [Sphingomonas jejuensis]